MKPTDPFEVGEQTPIRPDRHHHEFIKGSGDDFERKRIEESQKTSERLDADAGEELLLKGTSRSETVNNSRRKEQSFLAKQSKNAMMSSVSPREEQSISRAKKSLKTSNDEHMISVQTEGLSSGFDHPGLMHSDTDFTLSARKEKNKKAMTNSPSRPMSDWIIMGASSLFDRLMMSMGTQKGGASSSTRL